MRAYPKAPRSFPQPRKARGQHRRSAAERTRLLALFEHSGQTHKQFCHQHDLAPSTLALWLRQARQQVPAGSEGPMVEVPGGVAALGLPRGMAAPPPGSVDIRLPNRVRVSIPSGTDSAWVSQLLRELLTCSG